ncbi:MAG: beta strand repeat-containing protein [Akkermansia muciniphila]
MRLHLPKGLLAALLAACFALPAGAEGETVTQYGWKEGAPATSTDGTAWTNITYDSDHTLSTFTDGTIALGTLGNVKITDVPGGEWNTGSSVTGTADSAWFNMTGNKRIYLSCPDISKMSNVYLNGVHFVIGTGNSSKDTSNAISSNLFLGAGAWGADSGTVHYKAVLRANVDTNISGNVTLTDSSAHISTWGGKDITFAGSLNGNGKSLSVGAESADSVINLNGSTNLGSLTVGAGVDTNGSLSAKGAAISVVIGNSAVAQLGNLTLFGDSTLTNNGSLTISGTYSGNTITNTGILTLADAAVVDVGRLTNTITETATTDAEGTAISGRVTVNGGFTLASGGTVNTADNVRFTYNGFSYSGSLSEAEGNLSGTISGGYYRVVADDEVSYSTATTEANISHIEVLGTLTGVKDSSITTSIPITGNGSVAVDGVLETHVADLDQFTGTISLTGTSTDNLAAIKFGNSNAHLTQVSKIQLNANSYISGWSDLNFNYNLEFNGGFLLANQGSWVGANHLLSDSSIQVHKSANITGAFTAEAGKVLSIQASTFSEGAANPVLTFSGTVGKLDGATLQIEDGVTVAVTGNNVGNAQIAGAIVVNAGGTLKLTGADTLGYNSNSYDITDRITLTGEGGKVANLTLTAYQTLSTDLVLNGHTSVSGSSVNSFGGSITVSGTNNVFSTELKVREAITINVQGESDTFELSGSVNKYINSNGQLEGSGTITKTGSGTLIVSGANNNYPRAVAVNDGTLELRSAFNPVKIDLRGTDTTSGSLVIAAGGTGTVNLGSGDGDGLWMDADSTVSIRKAKSETTPGGKLIFGSSTSGATISATDADASISSSTTGQYIFSSADFSLADAEFLFNSTGQWGATLGNSLKNVSVINESSNLLLTVTHEGNTLRGIKATGGNVVLAADTVVTGQRSISVGSGKQVQVNAGKTLTYDAFKYVGTTITSSDTTQGISLYDDTTTVSGGTLTQTENHNTTEAKEVGAKLENVKFISESGMKTMLTNTANSYTGLSVAGELRLADTNVTVSEVVLSGGSLTVGSSKTLTANSLKLATASGSVLTGNLTLANSAGLVVNVDGITADTSTAVCTLSGALTLGSGLTLTLENLGTFEAGDEITLFSGVSGVTYTPQSTDETEVAMLSGDTTKPLGATGVDASQIFSNVDSGYFKLTYSGADNGGIVALVAQRAVPEPTTATLSLLALMGLAARRRRRKA